MIESGKANSPTTEYEDKNPTIPFGNGVNGRKKLFKSPNNHPDMNRSGIAARFNARTTLGLERSRVFW